MERDLPGKSSMEKRLIKFVKSETVLSAAFLLALVSCFLVPPDYKYGSYINYRVLILLFSIMSVTAGLNRIGIFEMISGKLTKKIHSTRNMALFLVLLCFIASMFLTNDITLMTMVPFTLMIFQKVEDTSARIHVLVIETVAANLGSMFTPFGNPQNLYLYAAYGYSLGSFLLLMLPFTLASLCLVILYTVTFHHMSSTLPDVSLTCDFHPDKKKLLGYLLLFVLAMLSVARVLDVRLLLLITVAGILLMDKSIFHAVDYSLLLTFVFFFIFVGNTARIPAISNQIMRIIEGRETLIAVLSSQIISNVPAAILLSSFTTNGRNLIVGTNIGGLGTLIASMASLITYRLYTESSHADRQKYLIHFTWVNVQILVVLYFLAFFLGDV